MPPREHDTLKPRVENTLHKPPQPEPAQTTTKTTRDTTAKPTAQPVEIPAVNPTHSNMHPYFMQQGAPVGMMFVGPHVHVMMAPSHGMPTHSALPHAGVYPGAHAHAIMMFAASGQPTMMHPPANVHAQAAHARAKAQAHAQEQAHKIQAHQIQAHQAHAHAQAKAQAAQIEGMRMQQMGVNRGARGEAVNSAVGGSQSAQAHYRVPEGVEGSMDVDGSVQVPTGSQGYVKFESHRENKMRIEHEKQELIREFNKKTREAALVRFSQKRSERRFGKLIRYDCRKKLADDRPRIKGRFVRIKFDEFDDDLECAPEVVPNFIER